MLVLRVNLGRVPLASIVAAVLATIASCGGIGDATNRIKVPPAETVPFGGLLDPSSLTVAPRDVPPPPPELWLPEIPADPIGGKVSGNRVLIIGDSLMASTARRHDGEMCDLLGDAGWTVDVEAVQNMFIEFADDVLDALLNPNQGSDWDVVAVFLGNNFSGDTESFARQLDAVIERLAPRPTILYTMTETDRSRAQLNDLIRSRANEHSNIVLIDWSEHAATDPDSLLGRDGLHLTKLGRERLELLTVTALGMAPGTASAECLTPLFIEMVDVSADSSGSPEGSTVSDDSTSSTSSG